MMAPWLAILLVLLVLPAAADRGNTLFGGTGGAVLPTADVLAPGQWNAAIDWFDTDVDDTIPLRINTGLSQGIEVGGMFSWSDITDVWGVNAKWVPGWDFGGGETALGFKFVDVDDFDGDGWQVYAVHTRSFGGAGDFVNFRGSLGINWTHVDILLFDDDAFRIFGLLEAVYRQWTFGIEMQSGDGDVGDVDPLSSIWARYRYDDRWTFQAGFSNSAPGGLVGEDSHDFFIGASYLFGPAGPTTTAF